MVGRMNGRLGKLCVMLAACDAGATMPGRACMRSTHVMPTQAS